MKKQVKNKKLRLNVETLRALDLKEAAGGGILSWSCEEEPRTRGFTNCRYCDSYTIQIPSGICI